MEFRAIYMNKAEIGVPYMDFLKRRNDCCSHTWDN